MSNLQPIITEKYEVSIYPKLQTLVSGLKLRHFNATEIYDTLANNHRKNYIPETYIDNLSVPLLIFDAMREDLGFKMKLNSTFRDPEHNREVDGKPDSMHLIAGAVDCAPMYYRANSVLKMHDWIQNTKIAIFYKGRWITNKTLGVGLYNTFVHVDDRGSYGRWSPVTWRGK